MDICKNSVYDQICLDVLNNLNCTISIFGNYEECECCEFIPLGFIPARSNKSLLINTRYPITMFYLYKGTEMPSFTKHFREHYRYGWNITETGFDIYNELHPQEICSTYMYILYAYLSFFALGLTYTVVKCAFDFTLRDFCKRYELWHNNIASVGEIQESLSFQKWKSRIHSLDTFRGICVTMMIFGNSGGAGFWFLEYSVWNGLHIADLVFPWFIWIMGFSMMISFSEKLKNGLPRKDFIYQVCRRSAQLVVLGIILNSQATAIYDLRLPGVLQRIGLVYFIVGMIEIFLRHPDSEEKETFRRFSLKGLFRDLTIAWKQWMVVLILTIVHTVILYVPDIPGCERGYTGPGGLHLGRSYHNCTGGVTGIVDRFIFNGHLTNESTFSNLYHNCSPFDSEGLLGTFSSVLTAYLGVQAGRIIYMYSHARSYFSRLILWGLFLSLIGGSLCGFSKNDGLIPINKNIWSLSFVFVSAGLAYLFLCLLYFLEDYWKKWDGQPFMYAGMNAITMYVGHILLSNYFPFSWNTETKSHASLLVLNLWTTGMWLGVALIMFSRNKFYSI